MNLKDMQSKIEEFAARLENGEFDHEYIGIRFEDAEREIGEILPESKYNDGRLDDRDFPEYGGEEYDDLPDAGGACAYTIKHMVQDMQQHIQLWGSDREAHKYFIGDHCYLVAGDHSGFASDHVRDEGEIVIEDAIVLEKLF